MALTAYCSSCRRTLYIEEGTTPVCPVCSTPLFETTEAEAAAQREADGAQSQP